MKIGIAFISKIIVLTIIIITVKQKGQKAKFFKIINEINFCLNV